MHLKIQILIVEDNIGALAALKMGLQDEGFTVHAAENGAGAQYYLDNWEYDGVVLDINLPDANGVELLKKWRSQGLESPVIMLTSLDTVEQKIEGLDAGADDYLAKPYNLQELVARLHSMMRRWKDSSGSLLTFGDVIIDPRHVSVTLKQEPVILNRQEYAILIALALRSGHSVSRGDLLDRIDTSAGDLESNLLDVLIYKLRKKLGKNLIQTVRGQGYRIQS